MSSFIKKIYIKKLRHLKEIEIDITNSNEKKHLILTGKNGSGKTTLLENIKNYLKSLEENDFNYISFEATKSIILNKTGSETGNNVEQREKCKKNLEYLESRIEGYENGVKYTFNDIESIEEKYKNNEFIIASFSAKRKSDILVPTSVNKVELMEKYSIESDIDNKFLDYLVYLKTQQSFARNEEDIDTVNEIGEWFNNFEEALKNLFGDTSIKLKFDYRNLNFKISQEGREDYGLNELSDGFSASLDILMNLILRMEKERKGLVYNTEGIVLIDELETHLHIELQKNILPFLTKFFPKIQFIITTHSPFIINSLENGVVYDLEKKIKLEDLTSYSYEGVVEGYFNVDKFSKEIKEKLLLYKELVNKNNKNDNEKAIELSLRKYFKTLPEGLASEVIFEFRRIELNRLTTETI